MLEVKGSSDLLLATSKSGNLTIHIGVCDSESDGESFNVDDVWELESRSRSVAISNWEQLSGKEDVPTDIPIPPNLDFPERMSLPAQLSHRSMYLRPCELFLGLKTAQALSSRNLLLLEESNPETELLESVQEYIERLAILDHVFLIPLLANEKW